MEAAAPKMDPALLSRDVTTFVIDSRETQAGDVFFALSPPEYADNGFNGDFDDATVHVRGAFASGAAACVVRSDRFEEHREELAQFESRLIFADDVIAGLQKLAHRVYLDWDRPVVAITLGSAATSNPPSRAAMQNASASR